MSLLVEDYLDEFEKFFDLLFTNTDEAVVKFTVRGLVARNMDSDRATAYVLVAPPQSFYVYRIDKEAFGTLSNRSRVKGVIRALRATGATRAAIRRKDNKIMLDDTEIGEFEEEKTEFDVPEFKIDLPNRITFDGRSLKRFLAQARKAGADAIGFAWTLAKREAVVAAFNDEVWLPFKDLFGLEIFQDAGAGYRIHLIEQFLPPTIFLRKGWPVVRMLGSRAYRMPIGLEYEFGTVSFKAYIAPNYDDSARFLEKLGLLRALTKEDILRQVEKKAPTAISAGEIEEALAKEGYEIVKVEEMLRQVVKEEKLNIREAGWKKLYFLPERPPVLKTLTEDVVLKTIRDFLEAVDTDAVGYSELESFLAREYLTEPLHSLLLSLKEKDLAESKPWPTRRPGGYAVDMRGYWGIKVPPPEQVVEEAKEAEKRVEEVKPKLTIGILVRDRVKRPSLGEIIEMNHLVTYRNLLKVPAEVVQAFLHDLEPVEKLDPDEVLLGIKVANGIEPKVLVLIAALVDTEKWVWSEEDFKKYVAEKNKIPSILTVEPVPPPKVPEGYVKVRFLRDMVRFMGVDRRMYGPFKAHEETIIPVQHAEVFQKHRYVEIVKQTVTGEHRSSSPEEPTRLHSQTHSAEEKQPITMEYKLLEYGAPE